MFNQNFNIELERLILSIGFLNRPESQGKLLLLEPDDFFDNENRSVFNAMCRMIEQGKEIDMVSLFIQIGEKHEKPIANIALEILADALIDQHIEELKEYKNKRLFEDVKKAKDPEQLAELIEEMNNNLYLGESSVIPPEEVKRLTFEYYNRGHSEMTSTGWLIADRYFKLTPGQLFIITGIPGMGKSEFLDALTMNLSNWNFVVFSPENLPVHRHAKKLAEKYSDMPFIEGYSQRMTEKDLDISLDYINNHYTFLNPPAEKRSIEYLLSEVSHIMKRKKINAFIIDPYNEIDSNYNLMKMQETQYISKFLMKIKAFAVYNKIIVFIIAHPTKLKKDEHDNYPLPTAYDISGSAHWYNKGDIIISIDRIENENKVTINVQKVKFKEWGERGQFTLNYDKLSGRFYE